MAEFARGPWYVKREVDGVPFDRHTRIFAVDADGVHHQVASTYNQTRANLQYAFDIAEANANLIAAAPDLYAALWALGDAVHTRMDDDSEIPDEVLDAASAALRKAEGNAAQ